MNVHVIYIADPNHNNHLVLLECACNPSCATKTLLYAAV